MEYIILFSRNSTLPVAKKLLDPERNKHNNRLKPYFNHHYHVKLAYSDSVGASCQLSSFFHAGWLCDVIACMKMGRGESFFILCVKYEDRKCGLELYQARQAVCVKSLNKFAYSPKLE